MPLLAGHCWGPCHANVGPDVCAPCPQRWDAVRTFPAKTLTVSPTLGRGTHFPRQNIHRVPDLGTRYTLSPPKRSPCPRPWDAVHTFPAQPFTVSPTLGRGARFSLPNRSPCPRLWDAVRAAPAKPLTAFPPAVAPSRTLSSGSTYRIHPVTPPHRHRSNFTPTTCNAQSASHHPPPPFQRHRSPASNSTCNAPPNISKVAPKRFRACARLLQTISRGPVMGRG